MLVPLFVSKVEHLLKRDEPGTAFAKHRGHRRQAPAAKGVVMAVPVTRGPAVRGAAPRIINVILGVWLFISAFVWPHTQAQMTNTWILGVLCVIFALVAMAVPWVRFLNTLLAIWLFISAWALPLVSVGTVWNNV